VADPDDLTCSRQAEESWHSRLLAWIYPNRGWADIPRPKERPHLHQREKRPTPGEPAGFHRRGETK
jgi:hypothetical protein